MINSLNASKSTRWFHFSLSFSREKPWLSQLNSPKSSPSSLKTSSLWKYRMSLSFSLLFKPQVLWFSLHFLLSCFICLVSEKLRGEVETKRNFAFICLVNYEIVDLLVFLGWKVCQDSIFLVLILNFYCYLSIATWLWKFQIRSKLSSVT